MLKRFEQFTSALSSMYRDVQKIERDEMEKQGLRGAFAQYLLAISRYPEGITAAELCEVCDKDKAAVSRVVTEMEARGLVEREADNQYRAKLHLTPAGEEAEAFVRKRASAAVELAGAGLSNEERKAFYAALERISASLQQISKTGIPE